MFLEVKSLFFVMHFGCIFVKIEVAFVAESYTTISQNILIHFFALQLVARFDHAAKPKRIWKVQARKQWDKKFEALLNIVVVGLLLSSYRIIIYGGSYRTSFLTAG